jgi:integrase
MAYIRPVKGGFRVECERKGQRASATFETRREAIDWGKRTDILLLQQQAPSGRTFAEAAAKYGLEVSSKKDGAKWEQLRLAAMVEYFGEMRLADIQAPQIAAWRDARLAGGHGRRAVAGSTVLRESNLLRNVFTVARDEWKWADHHPFKGVKLPEDAEPRHQRWTWQAIRRVLRRLGHVTGQAPKTNDQQIALAFLLTLSTSLRASECLRVGPTTFDRATRVIAVKAKGKLRSEIPVPRRAVRHCLLADFTITPADLDVGFRAARDATLAGDLRFHDGRASALTWLARRVDVMTLARISQHSDLRMLQRVYYRESAAEISARI